jgi:hypothetical protein
VRASEAQPVQVAPGPSCQSIVEAPKPEKPDALACFTLDQVAARITAAPPCLLLRKASGNLADAARLKFAQWQSFSGVHARHT